MLEVVTISGWRDGWRYDLDASGDGAIGLVSRGDAAPVDVPGPAHTGLVLPAPIAPRTYRRVAAA